MKLDGEKWDGLKVKNAEQISDLDAEVSQEALDASDLESRHKDSQKCMFHPLFTYVFVHECVW